MQSGKSSTRKFHHFQLIDEEKTGIFTDPEMIIAVWYRANIGMRQTRLVTCKKKSNITVILNGVVAGTRAYNMRCPICNAK